MKILFLAPQPFFQDRGTPIAVRLALEVISRRGSDEIHLLTYQEGRDLEMPQVKNFRIKAPTFLNGIRPGISVKKLLCDLIFFWTACRLVWRNRLEPYGLVHAVEESAFLAWFIKLLWKIPYVYDMDSSLAMQVTERWFLLKPLAPLFRYFEGVAVRGSTAVVPVCDALAVIAKRHGSNDLQILRDISLLDFDNETEKGLVRDLRREADLPEDALTLLYIGNLEPYQGIDLLIESFALAVAASAEGYLIIIGGIPEDLARYRDKVSKLNLAGRIHLLGPRPVSSLSAYLCQADILASPRTRGNNTPMKIYSYLHSGKAIVATRLPTHTQVLNDSVAKLAEPVNARFAEALQELLKDSKLRELLGGAAFKLAEGRYTFQVFERDLNALYDRLDRRINSR